MSDIENILNILRKCGIDLKDIPEKAKISVTDINISVKRPVTLFTNRGNYLTNLYIDEQKITDLFLKLCDYSLYRHSEEMKNGFIVIDNKYRCGICGTAIMKDGKVYGYKKITSLNIRIPRFIKGASYDIYNACKVNILYGLMVVGEPASGKTTVLKDLIKNLEKEYRVSVLDEKYELYSECECDVLLGVNKHEGLMHLMKNMSPEIIVCDELDERDIKMVEYAMSAGISLVASSHGNIGKSIIRPALYDLLSTYAFKTVVQLDARATPGKVKRIYDIEELNEIYRFYYDYRKRTAVRF